MAVGDSCLPAGKIARRKRTGVCRRPSRWPFKQIKIMKTNSTKSFHPVSAPDFLPPEQLQAIQLQRLKFMVQRAYNHVALFRKRMDDVSLEPTDVRSLEDITKLPFTVKTDLRDTYPFGLFASPMKDIV